MGAAGAHRDSRSYGSSGRVAPGRNRIALSAARRPRSLPARDDSRVTTGRGRGFPVPFFFFPHTDESFGKRTEQAGDSS